MNPPPTGSLRGLRTAFFAVLLVLFAFAVVVLWQHSLATRHALADAATERDLARLETRGLRNELAAEHLLAHHERETARRFADLASCWLTPLPDAPAAARALVLARQGTRDALLLADGLPALAAGESYALLVRPNSSPASSPSPVALPPPDARGMLRATFTLPAENSETDTPPAFTLVRHTAAGDVALLTTEPR